MYDSALFHEIIKMDEETMQWLESVDSKRFIGNFCDYGVQSLDDLYHLSIDDPNALTTTIGMKSLQAKKFKDMIRAKVKPAPLVSPKLGSVNGNASNSPVSSPNGGPQRSGSMSPPRMVHSPVYILIFHNIYIYTYID